MWCLQEAVEHYGRKAAEGMRRETDESSVRGGERRRGEGRSKSDQMKLVLRAG